MTVIRPTDIDNGDRALRTTFERWVAVVDKRINAESIYRDGAKEGPGSRSRRITFAEAVERERIVEQVLNPLFGWGLRPLAQQTILRRDELVAVGAPYASAWRSAINETWDHVVKGDHLVTTVGSQEGLTQTRS